MWGENVGWISLSCKNTLTCATADYGVTNDGHGGLSGFAWGENVGWIQFAPSTAGVNIDPATGDFSGAAWAENLGWIRFRCNDSETCNDVAFGVTSEWICDPAPPAPEGATVMQFDSSGRGALLTWSPAAGATGSDVVFGDVDCLRASAGDFATCTSRCLDAGRTTTTMRNPHPPAPGNAFWFLIRGRNCGGRSSYGNPTRDAAIASSGNDCP